MHQLAEKDFITITLLDSYPLFTLIPLSIKCIGNVYYKNEIDLMQHINRIRVPFYQG